MHTNEIRTRTGYSPGPQTGEPSAQGGTLPLGSSSESPEARALTFSGLAAVGSEEVVGGKNVKREGCHRTAFDSIGDKHTGTHTKRIAHNHKHKTAAGVAPSTFRLV